MIIAIDGTSSSGKGSLAKKLSEHFKLPYLNTGAIYRLVALKLIQKKIDPINIENYLDLLIDDIDLLSLENKKLFDENVGYTASIIAKNKNLRKGLFDFQKNFVENSKKNNGCILDGRDTTTVICPEADYKIFVTAEVEIRAKRRYLQLKDTSSYEEILDQLKNRDANDFNRSDAPLKIADGALIIDNTNLTIEQGFNKILQFINNKNDFTNKK